MTLAQGGFPKTNWGDFYSPLNTSTYQATKYGYTLPKTPMSNVPPSNLSLWDASVMGEKKYNDQTFIANEYYAKKPPMMPQATAEFTTAGGVNPLQVKEVSTILAPDPETIMEVPTASTEPYGIPYVKSTADPAPNDPMNQLDSYNPAMWSLSMKVPTPAEAAINSKAVISQAVSGWSYAWNTSINTGIPETTVAYGHMTADAVLKDRGDTQRETRRWKNAKEDPISKGQYEQLPGKYKRQYKQNYTGIDTRRWAVGGDVGPVVNEITITRNTFDTSWPFLMIFILAVGGFYVIQGIRAQP